MQCAICFDDDIIDHIKTNCGHTFHKNCLNTWIKIRDICPYCTKYMPLVKWHNSEKIRRKIVLMIQISDFSVVVTLILEKIIAILVIYVYIYIWMTNMIYNTYLYIK